MKNKQFFGFGYILNFTLSLAFIIMMFYFNRRYPENDGNIIAITFFSSIFLLIVTPFNWLCYSLHKKYRSNQQLSKKAKITGTIFFVLFSLLSILQIVGTVELIDDAITNRSYIDTQLIFITSLFLSITLTSIYLCFAYWVIRKQTRKQFVDIIAQLGQEAIT